MRCGWKQQRPCSYLCVYTCRFLSGEGPQADKECSRRFKLIPSVLQGSWIIKQAVGNTPVLLGTKLDTKYFRCAPDPGPLPGYNK